MVDMGCAVWLTPDQVVEYEIVNGEYKGFIFPTWYFE